MEGLEGAPPWVQWVVGVAVFLGTTGWTILNYTKKKVGEKLDSQESKEAVVISAAFADRTTIERLDRTVENLADCVRELRHATDRNTAVIENQTGVQADRLNRIGDLLADRRIK